MVNPRILIVDDEPEVRWILEKRLTNAGYQVVQAENGKEAVGRAMEEPPDLILLDIDMPEMDGGEVKAILREYNETKEIPIIFLTCLITPEDQKQDNRAMDNSVFMCKPYKPEELLAEIERILKTNVS